MFEAIDETPNNVCGVIGNRYVIAGPVDEPVEKAFMYFHLYDDFSRGEKEKVLVIVDIQINVTSLESKIEEGYLQW